MNLSVVQFSPYTESNERCPWQDEGRTIQTTTATLRDGWMDEWIDGVTDWLTDCSVALCILTDWPSLYALSVSSMFVCQSVRPFIVRLFVCKSFRSFSQQTKFAFFISPCAFKNALLCVFNIHIQKSTFYMSENVCWHVSSFIYVCMYACMETAHTHVCVTVFAAVFKLRSSCVSVSNALNKWLLNVHIRFYFWVNLWCEQWTLTINEFIPPW